MPQTQTQPILSSLKQHTVRLYRILINLDKIDERYFWLRLGVLLVGGLALFLSAFRNPAWATWLIGSIGMIIFVIVVRFHQKLDHSRLRFRLALRQVESQIARLELDWDKIPRPPAVEAELSAALPQYPPASPISAHPFAADLDIMGSRSLHHLIDTSISTGGSLRLLKWLLQTAPDTDLIAEHQALLAELIAKPGYRRRLALNSALVIHRTRTGWDGEKILHWLENDAPHGSLRPALLWLSALAVLNILLLALQLLAGFPPWWLISFAAYLMLYFSRYRRFDDLFSDAYTLDKSLGQLAELLYFLERHSYTPGSRLERLCSPFYQEKESPSRLLRSIARIVSAASLKNNLLIWLPLNLLTPWDFFFAHRLSLAKEALKDHLPLWLDAWYELEASISLANFAALNPAYAFPEILPHMPPAGAAVFQGEGLGHPMIRRDRRVVNDFSLSHLGEIGLFTGSNMSGKSTFLRTLGVNLVLAFAGAPVCADRMQTLPFRIFTCIQVSDSLNDGISYFYAEVKRLKELLDALQANHPAPLFFLIDEIFRGTNNREREQGSRAYVKALTGGRGVGAISTHDLELVNLAKEQPDIHNFHFQEEIQDGRMVFDYKLRPGPSPTTNALKIMELEGLPVDPSR